ncbi:hypothetical protein HK100_004313 [Physocladia obscura]|uniref:Ammonium transporter AmtB-like domain-containing protein n=1 Tax=Physocladia obscura TaxID=109957 RepID=A0AAD5SU03_9FUNG|nr:hypothetical protein HK100_004313 [Physocladia obscura]
MIPSLALFYSGLAESKNSISIAITIILLFSISSIQWALFGYSLSFSDTSNSGLIGNFDYFALLGTLKKTNPTAPTIPESLFALYQMMFAGIAPPLYLGGVAGRIRIIPLLAFTFLWSTFVYDPVDYWVWANNGWLFRLNVLDYAGGSVTHITSGVTALILAWMLGPRIDYEPYKDYPVHSPMFGWNGFNGGSSVAANARGVNAAFATNLSASAAGCVWMALEMFVNKKKLSAVAFCTGAVVGLATITPGSGFVQPAMGILFGIIGAVSSFYAIKFVKWLRVDDTLDAFATHGVGGSVGMLLAGIFAQYEVSAMQTNAGVVLSAGWIDGVWIQVPIQLFAILAVILWSAGWTILIVSVLNKFEVTKLRCSSEAELHGLDTYEVGEDDMPYLRMHTDKRGDEEGLLKV